MAEDDAKRRARGRGRPRSPEPATTLSTWVRASDYDRLVRLANQRETSVSALVRTIIHDAKSQ